MWPWLLWSKFFRAFCSVLCAVFVCVCWCVGSLVGGLVVFWGSVVWLLFLISVSVLGNLFIWRMVWFVVIVHVIVIVWLMCEL